MQNREKLAESNEPAALIILANQMAQRTKGEPEKRYRERLNLTLRLYGKQLGLNETHELQRLIDWMMKLPADFEKDIYQELKQVTERKHMPYIMEFEREAMERGEINSLKEGVLRALKRSGPVPDDVVKMVEGESNKKRLLKGLDLAYLSKDIADFKKKFQKRTATA
jgi:hypothetical protein